ncbi:hypothetical protein BD309DRAFT_344001 [Dichomitus squalens]|nr:hypothetical protein BD309DRAFT_344001 [Dichomitus squalens]
MLVAECVHISLTHPRIRLRLRFFRAQKISRRSGTGAEGPAKCINCGVSTNNHRFRCDWLHCTMMRKVADFPSPRAPEKPSSSHVTGATMP